MIQCGDRKVIELTKQINEQKNIVVCFDEKAQKKTGHLHKKETL